MPFEGVALSPSILIRYIEPTISCHLLAYHRLAHHFLAHYLYNYRQFEDLGESWRGRKSQGRKKSRRRKKITKIAAAIQIVYVLQLILFIAKNNQLALYLHLM